MFRKAMFEHGIRFVVYCREDEIQRIELTLTCKFIAWMP
jgi:hypothetical protein